MSVIVDIWEVDGWLVIKYTKSFKRAEFMDRLFIRGE